MIVTSTIENIEILHKYHYIWYGLIGAIALIIYGVIPTLQPPSANFGRVYAAYGGICILNVL
ncbi:hypothetical protein ND00_10670 [Clostridium sp. L74]|nr:hypothetical protein ND00_10670 [Clostridium sp. L74]